MKSISFQIKRLALPMILILMPGCQLRNSDRKAYSDEYGRAVDRARTELITKYGEGHRERIDRGLAQVGKNWRNMDGAAEDLTTFCLQNFLHDSLLRANFLRIQRNLAVQQGYLSKIRFSFTESERFTDGIQFGADEFFRKAVPESDPYKVKLAHFIQLNFPAYTLEEKRRYGSSWSREKWAMVRLGDQYAERGDPDFKSPYEDEAREFEKYIGRYYFRMNHILGPDGTYPFTRPLILHSHFGLRDNLKEDYTRTGGLARQETTGRIIEHIALGTVPTEIINDTAIHWDPWNNRVFRLENGKQVEIQPIPEGTKRYAGLLSEFKKKSAHDKTFAEGSTVITRTFANANLQLEEVEVLIRSFLADPVLAEVGKLVSHRLGRPLQPFDIWYSGFQAQSAFPADLLDSITRSRYPKPIFLEKDLPRILTLMGFPEDEARYVGSHATVRPVKGGGYSDPPPMRGDTALMTTVFNPDGLDFKAFRIAMHELGHVVCGVYSTSEADHWLLADVPTGGITEGMAELLAYKNIEGLGLAKGSPEDQKGLLALASLWYMLDLGGQSLTEIETWKWLYDHPGATPEQLKSAVLEISQGIWNQYYTKVFGGIRDQHILGIYNHFITGSLYLFNYFIGNVVMFQLYDAFPADQLAMGLKKACAEGNTIPELWMEHSVGRNLSVEPLLKAAREAIGKIGVID